MSGYVRITERKIELTDEGVEALMSDYTPTTEQIRKGLLTGYVSDAEFDRWLESTLQKAQIVERERIISNIYERVSDLRSCTKDDNCVELGELIEEYIPEWTEGENK